MASIDAKYELWKNKLLDLGRRNKLINYKDTRMSSLKITSPDCSSLFDYFVKEEHPLVFPHVNDPIPSGMFSDPAETALTIREEAIEDMPEEDEYISKSYGYQNNTGYPCLLSILWLRLLPMFAIPPTRYLAA